MEAAHAPTVADGPGLALTTVAAIPTVRRLSDGLTEERVFVAEKMTKKELKAPDALQRAGLEATSMLEGKEKFLVGGLVALVVIGLIAAIIDALGDRSEARAERALGAAMEPVTRQVAEAETTPNPNETEPPFASQQAKDEAVIGSLTTFRQEHSGTKSAATAALPLGQSLHRLGRHDDAVKAFDDFLGGAAKDNQLRAVALEGKGYAFEAKGELDQALAAFSDLAKLDLPFLQGMGLFHQGRILSLQGKHAEAAKVFAEIPQKFPNTAAARQAQERLNLLASQGVAVPEVKPSAAAGTGGAAGQN